VSDGALVEVVVPQLGEAVSEVRIVEWLKSEGDQISTGDVLFIVDTEKAEVDVEAFVDGVLVEIAVADDTATLPGAVVGLLRTPAGDANAAPRSARAEPAVEVDVSSIPTPLVRENSQPALTPTEFTPKARRLARELGVDPAEATSSRSDGVVAEADILLLAAQGSGETRDVARRIGETMAVRMAESKRTVPHFYLMVDVDMSRVLSLREEIDASRRGIPSLTSFVVFAAAHAARAHPHLFSDDGEPTATGIGVAVATDAGLVVPAVQTDDLPDLWTVDERISGAAERARQLKLHPSDLVPKRMTVSNLGMLGIDSFYGIIDPPDTMLITVGATRERVVAQHKEISVRPIASFGLSADHRRMDGAAAASFLTDLRRILESIDDLVVIVDGG